jgi:hypothetical protein
MDTNPPRLPPIKKTFEITFIHWSQETGENICDFCEKKQVRWYCEELVLGYCEKCMSEQSKELLEKP